MPIEPHPCINIFFYLLQEFRSPSLSWQRFLHGKQIQIVSQTDDVCEQLEWLQQPYGELVHLVVDLSTNDD
eukprot:snap_masked-scaffold_4-processed-gene-5.46-mRNA-1 protein AED:1.00 eAED:1.00 QI:0/0/0/0/1/1/2/0/70